MRALDRLTPRGPKSTQSLIAGRSASGNGFASTTTPTRMSTRAKSSQEMLMPGRRLSLLEACECGARVVIERDRVSAVALLGHRLRAPLVEADAVPVAAAYESRDAADHRDREQGALQRVVADETPQIVSTEHGP